MTDEEFDAISDGLVDGYALLERIGCEGRAPREDSLEQLDALESALVRIKRGDVTSNKDVSDADLALVREVRAMVAAWNEGGECPEGLIEKVAILRARERARAPVTAAK